MRYLAVKNWTEFQHYKDRNPPWIKLHRALLDDYEFSRLQDASKAHLMLIWLFASQNDGRIPEDAKFLQKKLSLDRPPNLKAFMDHGLLIPEQDASTEIAEGKQGDSAAQAFARSQEERREEESTRQFEAFWQSYPRKIARQDALKAWQKLRLQNGDFERVMDALSAVCRSDQWTREGGKYIPHAATWLNGRRFDDEREPERPRKVSL